MTQGKVKIEGMNIEGRGRRRRRREIVLIG